MTTSKYIHMVNILEDMIESMDKNEMIPSERSLAEMHGMSRMTVRKAINMLVEDNKLYRVSKVGTFTTDKKIYKKAEAFSGFTTEVLEAGGTPSSVLIEFSLQAANQTVSEHLNIREGSLVYKVVRLRKNNDIPVMIDESYFPRQVIKLNEDVVESSIYQYAHETLGLPIVKADQRFRATFINPLYQKYLDVSEYTPMMNVEISVYLKDGRVFEWTNTYINSVHYEIMSTSYH